ncbi:SCO family protein [Tamilnaduibacter salinus]|nr:SCO family protein [Tamilnaduibacter salinus]
MPELSYSLTNSKGEPASASDYEGQVRAMFFGFTNCPDVCPTTMAELNKAVKAMPDDKQDDMTVLFVSVDPERDTPEKLAQYTNFFGDRIVGMTGPEASLRDLAKRYRTTFGYGEPNEEGNYDVSHSGAIYVFDEQGKARLLMRSDLTPEQMAADFEALMTEAG